jgi:hypothetical protein
MAISADLILWAQGLVFPPLTYFLRSISIRLSCELIKLLLPIFSPFDIIHHSSNKCGRVPEFAILFKRTFHNHFDMIMMREGKLPAYVFYRIFRVSAQVSSN